HSYDHKKVRSQHHIDSGNPWLYATFKMVLRFIFLFVGLFAMQLLALHFAYGFQRIYAPFVGLVEPLVRRHYGGSDGSLGPLLIWGMLLGTTVYSAVLACIGAFLISRI